LFHKVKQKTGYLF